MLSLRRMLRGPEASVRSLAVQANESQPQRQRPVVEILTHHLLFRLTHNEALGEDVAAKMIQVAYMFALPGVLMALYLVAPYHQPHAPRPYWSQAADHYVYTVYSFVVIGAVTVFEWEMLFPDLLDVFVLSTLPIANRVLLRARLLTLAVFLGLTVIGTNALGAIFFPVLAELHAMWIRHTTAHVAAVMMAGLFAAALFIALQGVLHCVLGRRVFDVLSPVVQALSMVALLTVLFLTPLIAGNLEALLASGEPAVRWFPPFWFLGVYEVVMHGSAAPPMFASFATTAVIATAGALMLAAAIYPLAYARRVRQLVEGEGAGRRTRLGTNLVRRALHLTLLPSPQMRAIYHFISQTILRVPRLRLYLTMYVGVALALAISGALNLVVHHRHVQFHCSEWGLRAAMVLLAFLLVMGMRTAMSAPVALQGSWIFLVVHGRPLPEHMRAVFVWVGVVVSAAVLAVTAVVEVLAPPAMHAGLAVMTQILVGVGISVLLSLVLLLRLREVPFTAIKIPSTRDLPMSFVRYMVILPAFVLYVVDRESWIEASWKNLILTAALFVAVYFLLVWTRGEYLKRREADSTADEAVLFSQLGLQE